MNRFSINVGDLSSSKVIMSGPLFDTLNPEASLLLLLVVVAAIVTEVVLLLLFSCAPIEDNADEDCMKFSSIILS